MIHSIARLVAITSVFALCACADNFDKATPPLAIAAQQDSNSFYDQLSQEESRDKPMSAYQTPRQERTAIRGATKNTFRTRAIVNKNMDPGTILILTQERALYYGVGDGKAIRYVISVGRDGFDWRGKRHIGNKREWPDWTPPPEMLAREPYLPRHMEGGINNPLGSRALYIYTNADNKDTKYRIHGTNHPETLGKAMSSGCFRMLNKDVEELYSFVDKGTLVDVE